MDFLTPEFVVSNITGAGVSASTVYLILKGKTDVLRESIKNLSEQLAVFHAGLVRRVERLENHKFNEAD